MSIKILVSALAAVAAIGLQAVTSYTATEQYVQNVVKAESNRTDLAIGALRQEVLDAKYLTPSAIKAGTNVSVTTNAAGEVTIAADGGAEVDFTTNNTVLVTTIETVAPAPADYANVSNAAINALSRAEAEAGFTEWVCEPDIVTVYWDDFRERWATTPDDSTPQSEEAYNPNATNIAFAIENGGDLVTATRTRLPTMADIPTAQINAATTTNALQDVAIAGKADKPAPFTPGNLAALDTQGNLEDSGIAKTNVASVLDTELSPVTTWIFTPASISVGGQDYVLSTDYSVSTGTGRWVLYAQGNGYPPVAIGYADGSLDVMYLEFTIDPAVSFEGDITSTRSVIGYTLGSQTNKVLQAQGDYATKKDLENLGLTVTVEGTTLKFSYPQ